MKKIGITLDFVIRDYMTKLKELYVNKYNSEPLRVESTEDLYQYFPLPLNNITTTNLDEDGNPLEEGLTRQIVSETSDELCVDEETFKQFFTVDFTYEILGACKEIIFNAMFHVNLLNKELNSKGYELVLICEDNSFGRPSTLYFLSKTSCMLKTILFLTPDSKELNKFHTIITAEEKFAKAKNIVKIKSDYNDSFECDSVFNNIKEVTVQDLLK